MRKKNQKIIWSFHSDFDNEDCCLLGCNNFICGKNTSVSQRSLLYEVSPKRRQIYTIRLRGDTFQLIAFFKRRGSWWGTGREEDCEDTEWRNLEWRRGDEGQINGRRRKTQRNLEVKEVRNILILAGDYCPRHCTVFSAFVRVVP